MEYVPCHERRFPLMLQPLAAKVRAGYAFWMNEFCAVYLEMVKVVRYGADATAAEKDAAQATLYVVISAVLRLLHPLMPFVTEELYQRLPGRDHRPLRAGEDGARGADRPVDDGRRAVLPLPRWLHASHPA